MGCPHACTTKITSQKMAVIIPKSIPKKNLIQFYHAACFSPSPHTFLQAVKKGIFQSWPRLTPVLVTKFLTPMITTHFGHLKQERQNLQSTQQSNDTDNFPTPVTPHTETNEIMATINSYQSTKKAFGDLPGKFPFTSTRGSQYFLVIYHYGSNAILVHTLKNRTALEIQQAYISIYNALKARGCTPKTFILDNETSNRLLNPTQVYLLGNISLVITISKQLPS